MPDQSSPVSISMDFICAQKTVWKVLSTPRLYDKWYTSFGNVESDAEEAMLSLGAKLKFRGKAVTTVVTVFEPMSRIVLTTGTQTEAFHITPTEFGCRVSAHTAGHSLTAEEQQQKNTEMLTRLKDTAYDNMEHEPVGLPILPRRRHRRLREIVAGIMQGYKTPLELTDSAMENADEMAAVVDRTENDIIIHTRAGLVAIICAVFLFSTLTVTTRIESGSMVPSSGMDLYVSEDVNKENASRIYIGQYVSDLQLMLNCVGTRLSATEYHYASLDGHIQLIVSYDAYGRVRQARFLDYDVALAMVQVPVLEAAAVLDANMTLAQVEDVYGLKLSAFILEKSGETTVYFGKLENVERMSVERELDRQIETEKQFRPELTAQIVVTLNKTYTAVRYFLSPDIDNPLPTFELTDAVKRQYNGNIASYRFDRAAYERLYLLFGTQRTDAEIMLGTIGEDYVVVGGTGGDILGSYILRSTAVDEAAYRYLYTAQFDEREERISEVTMLNRYLEARSDILPAQGSYTLTKNMPLYYVYAQLGILPTYTILNGDTLTICFGMRIAESRVAARNFELCLVFDAKTQLVMEIYDNR